MILGGEDERYVATIQIAQKPRHMGLLYEAEREANATLLLATLDMYEALKDAEAAIVHLNGEIACEETLHAIRSALAKAEGK